MSDFENSNACWFLFSSKKEFPPVPLPSVQLYQLVTDLDLVVLNSCGAGVPVGPMYLASLGQTDDQVFVSFSLFANGSGLDSAVEMATAINLVNVPSTKKVIVVMPRDSLVRMLELLDVDGVLSWCPVRLHCQGKFAH